MRKILISAAAGAAIAVVPAMAAKPATHPTHPTTSAKCKQHSVGYNAKGTVTSQSLAAGTMPGRFTGNITVTIKKANHKVTQTSFDVTNIKVHWKDTNGDGLPNEIIAGDRAGLHGKVTKLGKKCDQTGFTATVTLKKVDFKKAKTA